MARPPVEWPIPQYVVELRERVVVTCRVPTTAVAERVPLPVQPLSADGQAVVSLCLANGRVLKSAGGVERLASEFHTAELLTPAVWRPACRPAVRGNYVLAFFSDRQSIRRLVQTGAGLQAGGLRWLPASGRGGHTWEGRIEDQGGFRLRVPMPLAEVPWPDGSVFSSHEAAEAQLLHPEVLFVRGWDGRAVHAAPVHQYARATVHVEAEWDGVLEQLGGLLGVPAQRVEVDHVFFQKRCTHTLFFPPERIPVAVSPSRVALGPPVCAAA